MSQCKTNFSKIKTKLWSSASGGEISDLKTDRIDQQMGTISNSMDDLKLRLTALEHNFNLAPDREMFGGIELSDPIDSLQQRIIKMETTLEASMDLRGTYKGEKDPDEVNNRFNALENRIAVNIETDIRDLQDRVSDLEGQQGTQTYSFGSGYRWNSDEDLESWFEEELPRSCGVFWDLFSALVYIAEVKKPTGKELADTNYSATRTHTTPFENDLVASMSHDLPGVFFHETTHGMIASKEEGFTRCKSYAQWMGSSANKPYKRLVQERLQHFVTSIRGTMRGGSGNWFLIADTMLNNLVTQFHELSGFIQGFYNELIQVSQFKPERAWVLVGRCVGAVFEDQRKYRAKAEKIVSLTTVSGKAQLFSAVLKSHEIMEDFLLAGFRAHPLIVKEISLFMLKERVDPLEMEALSGEVDKLRQDLKKLSLANADLKKTVGDQKEELKRLKDRITAQEKKK